MVKLTQYLTLKNSARLLVAFSFFMILACDPDEPLDPAPPPPPPPPPTLQDTLLGKYSGTCIYTDTYMDFMTGQQIVTRDTQDHDILIVDIDTSEVGTYTLTFEGLYFEYFFTGPTEIGKDTIKMNFLFSEHNENVTLIPKQGLLISFASHSNPGFGNSTTACRCQKSF